MKKDSRKISELSDRELIERQTMHLAEINKRVKSTDSNVRFLFWVIVASITSSLLVLS